MGVFYSNHLQDKTAIAGVPHAVKLIMNKNVIHAAGKKREIKSDSEIAALRDSFEAINHFKALGDESLTTSLEWLLAGPELAQQSKAYLLQLATNAENVGNAFAKQMTSKLTKPTETLLNKLVGQAVPESEFVDAFKLQEVKAAHNALKAVLENVKDKVATVDEAVYNSSALVQKATQALLTSKFQVNKNGVLFMLGHRNISHVTQGRQKRRKLEQIWKNIVASPDVLEMFDEATKTRVGETLALGVAGKFEAAPGDVASGDEAGA